MTLLWRACAARCRCCGARSAAAQARPQGLVGRSALRADSAAMLASGSRRRTRTAHCVRSARTTAASQLTKRAARAYPDAALLAALKGPAAGPARQLRGTRSRSPQQAAGIAIRAYRCVGRPAGVQLQDGHRVLEGDRLRTDPVPGPSAHPPEQRPQPPLGRLQALRGERHRLRLAHRVGAQPLWRAAGPWRRSRRTSRRGHPHAPPSAATSARRRRGVRCPARWRDASIQAGTSASSGLCAPMPPTFRTWV